MKTAKTIEEISKHVNLERDVLKLNLTLSLKRR